MVAFSLKLRGLSEAQAVVRGWAAQEFVARTAPEAARALVAWLRVYIPRRTGKTADTIGSAQAGTHVLAAGDLIALYLRTGTRPHVITAKNAQVLAFIGRGGDMVFRRSVHHPGTRGIDYPLQAWQAAAPEIQAYARQQAAVLIGGRP